MDVYRADALHKSDETQAQVRDISAQLTKLTEQLNVFKPASVENVRKGYEKVASDVQQKFDAQQQEIQNLSTVVLETQKAMQTNVETLHSLLTRMENLGENMRSMQEDMMSWQQEFHNEEEEFQELQDQLLWEVPLADPVRDQNAGIIPPVVSKPPTTLPKMPTIVEEPAIQSKDQSEVPRTSEEERLDSYSMERWRRLVGKDVREPIKGNKVPGPAGRSNTDSAIL